MNMQYVKKKKMWDTAEVAETGESIAHTHKSLHYKNGG